MEIAELLNNDTILTSPFITSKKQALEELARHSSDLIGIKHRDIFDQLLQREKLGTTGIGNGVAIPHCRLSDLDRIYGVFLKIDDPIDFDAIDEQPVDLIFLLLAPETHGADHLRTLSKITRTLRDPNLCQKIRGCQDSDAILALLSEATCGHAA